MVSAPAAALLDAIATNSAPKDQAGVISLELHLGERVEREREGDAYQIAPSMVLACQYHQNGHG